MMTQVEAAQHALLITYAMAMYQSDKASLAPAPDPRLAPNWKLLGYLTANDSIFKIGMREIGQEACYGFLAQSVADPSCFAVAIRGTDSAAEWILDAEFLPMNHPTAGTVETGFWSVYRSMLYRPLGEDPSAAAPGIAEAVGSGRVIILGHSLGSPISAYLSFDLAGVLGGRVEAAMFACPRPGNMAFGKAFAARVSAYQVWNYNLDVVPRLPSGPDYWDLPGVNWLRAPSPQAAIYDSLSCNHHLLSYCAMLAHDSIDWPLLLSQDAEAAFCIRAPAP